MSDFSKICMISVTLQKYTEPMSDFSKIHMISVTLQKFTDSMSVSNFSKICIISVTLQKFNVLVMGGCTKVFLWVFVVLY